MLREVVAFPVEKRKMLTEKEQELLAEYKRKEKQANTAINKMYYIGRIHAFYEIADLIYQERLERELKK
ncbi:hypothetical protein [Aquibacillus rhizosphaerae]|uniref:Uncharacterized protein n=1 Tax=Aquibacillus rhizosphaerae TaxID=3051431 RepID=A0ABT7L3F5_9BACI|nr:hypothetical protein [Aquibacillus sp. LR5S19]MDL4840388.1 hypothetical protein [Aquibacillus sp. LR5S19]